MQNSKVQQEDKSFTGNAFDQIIKEDWKSEEDYKKKIVALELQNEKYRNQLYEFGQTVNKILQKTKVPQSNKAKTPNLQQQLQLVRKQLDNVNQFIKIYQNQINALGNKKKKDQMESMANTQQVLKAKTQEMNNLKKQLKQLTHKNKGLQYKLLQYSRKNKAKSLDQQALQLKQLINQNKNLKNKLQQLQNMQQKKQNWLSNNMKSAKDLQKKLKEQQSRLPKIQSRGSLRQKNAASSLPKLQSEKKIYTKWLQSSRGKSHSRIDKQLQDLQKINQMIQQKIKVTTRQIQQIQLNTQKVREKVQANQQQFIQQQVEEGPKKKDFGVMVSKKVRKLRRDWVGKFDNLRFSDSRSIRQQTRVFKILFNTSGYYQFFYYSCKDKKKIYVGKLPFDTNSLTQQGKQSTFTVDHPDFIKAIRLKINLRTQRILQMIMTSNLGIQGQFIVDATQNASGSKPNTSKPLTTQGNDQQVQIYYDMDIKPSQAISCMFGSYGVKLDEKKNIVAVWLEGIGAELIQDFVEQAL